MKWESEYGKAGGSLELPKATGIRILMMPFWMADITSVPFPAWHKLIETMVEFSEIYQGTGYLTIDEGMVQKNKIHRRPGLHVDGWSKDGTGELYPGGMWGGGGVWGGKDNGMLMISNMYGCNIYPGLFQGEPKEFGDCEHLRDQIQQTHLCGLNTIYRCGSMTVHESMPSMADGIRQFVRLSTPSEAAWPSSCTPNPLGVLPAGPIVGPRPQGFTNYAA